MEIFDELSCKNRKIEFFDIFATGSNSNVFSAKIDGDQCIYAAKCSKNSKNYVSFNMQCKSYITMKKSIFEKDIIIPNVYLYGKSKQIGDVLIMDKYDNLYDIAFIINNSFHYGEYIIKLIADVIAELHNQKISGYDIEFYWKADTNQLVVLDMGPQYTINCSNYEIIREHWNFEEDNYMGKWNIISQIVPNDMAKKMFGNDFSESVFEILEQYIDLENTKKHITNVAYVHALTIFAKLARYKQNEYINVFIKEYKRKINEYTFDNMIYIKGIKTAISCHINKATAKLYYSKVETLSTVSCSACLEW